MECMDVPVRGVFNAVCTRLRDKRDGGVCLFNQLGREQVSRWKKEVVIDIRKDKPHAQTVREEPRDEKWRLGRERVSLSVKELPVDVQRVRPHPQASREDPRYENQPTREDSRRRPQGAREQPVESIRRKPIHIKKKSSRHVLLESYHQRGAEGKQERHMQPCHSPRHDDAKPNGRKIN
jgi:hypothetical protein